MKIEGTPERGPRGTWHHPGASPSVAQPYTGVPADNIQQPIYDCANDPLSEAVNADYREDDGVTLSMRLLL